MRAEIPAIVIVILPQININHLKFLLLKRINKNTPAVTKVDECTKADTGVGAAIAAGNHLEKGICALLVKAAKISNKLIV